MLDLSIVYSILTSLFIVILFFILPMFYTILLETKIDKLEHFLIKNRKNPAYHILYATAHRQDEEVEDLINQLVHIYKAPHHQASFKAMYGIYIKDLTYVKKQIEHIKPAVSRHYYDAYVNIKDGDLELARTIIEKVKKPWMRSALLSEFELESGNRNEAIAHARQAIHTCKGLQKYVVYKNYERELPESIAK